MKDHTDDPYEDTKKLPEKRDEAKPVSPLKKKIPPTASQKNAETLPKSNPPNPPQPSPAKSTEEVIAEAKKMHEQIEKQLDSIYRSSGFSPEEISDFLNNPNNYKNGKWATAQEFRERLRNQILKKLGKDPKVLQKEKSDSPVVRKKKTLGGRKGWMPMK